MASKAERERAIAAATELVRSGRLFVQRAAATVTEDDDQDKPRDLRYERVIFDKGWIKATRYVGNSRLRWNVIAYALGHKLHFTVKRDA